MVTIKNGFEEKTSFRLTENEKKILEEYRAKNHFNSMSAFLKYAVFQFIESQK